MINVGSPACGVNAAVRSIIRYGLCEGHNMYAVFDGFEGLINNQVRREILCFVCVCVCFQLICYFRLKNSTGWL